MKTAHNIDMMDMKILSLLLKNSKIPYSDISKELKLSTSAIHMRIKKLESLKVIKNYTINADFYKLKLYLTAFIGITIDGKMHEEVAKELVQIKDLAELHNTTGQYNMFAKIICRDPKQLSEILIKRVNCIAGIDKTETIISLGQLVCSPDRLLD